MKALQLKFNLIDKLIGLNDKEILHKVESLLSNTKINPSEKFRLTEEQLKMLKSSEDDIFNQRIISDEELNAEEDKWLNR